MRRRTHTRLPVFAFPIDEFFLRHAVDALPPRFARGGSHGDIREDRIVLQGSSDVRIRFRVGAGRDAEETGFGINGAQRAVGRDMHPRDVVPVSYTHLDVYKRQLWLRAGICDRNRNSQSRMEWTKMESGN